MNWVHSHLDDAADPVTFTGTYHPSPGQPSIAEELRRHLSAYEWAGVKYVVVQAGKSPFTRALSTRTSKTDGRTLQLLPGQSAHGVVPARVIISAARID